MRFLTLAAHKAFGRNAYREAIGQLRMAIDFVGRLPEGAPRLRDELELRSLLGQALVAIDGWSAPEVETSFLRARELAEQLSDNEPLVPVLLALATIYEVRGEVAKAQALVEASEPLAALGSPQQRLESHEILACSFFHQGSFTRALEEAGRGIVVDAEGSPSHYDTFPATLGDNAGVSCHDWAALALWFLGRPDEALARAEHAVRLAEEPGRAYGLATAQAQMTVLLQLRRDCDGAREWAEATMALATDRGYAYRAAMARVVRGWALGALGSRFEGVAEVERGISAARATGAHMDDPYFLGLLGDAYLGAGRLDEAFGAVDEALEIARRERSLFYVAELLRLRARITVAAAGDPDEAEALLRDALDLARTQQTRALELRAALTLAEISRGTAREPRTRQILQDVYLTFDQGFDTPDLVGAAELLDELREDAGPPRAAGPRPVRPPIRYAKSDGLSIAYQVSGAGEIDLVLVPGFVSHLEIDWDDPRHARFLDRLGSFARLIRFDKRGTGLSDRPQGLPDTETRMDDVRAVMEAVGTERPVVFGYSEGGPMSILFAATYPERVRALVLYDAFAKRTPRRRLPVGRDTGGAACVCGADRPRVGLGSRHATHVPERGRGDGSLVGRASACRGEPGAARTLIEMNSLIDVRDALSAVHVPTLVLHARTTTIVFVEESRYIAERIPDAQFVELDGIDHFVAIDPDQIVDEVERFLAGVAPAGATDRVLKTIVVAHADVGHEDVLQQVLNRFEGELAQLAGETRLALFDGPARAIRAALELRRRLDAAGAPIRVGVHTGEVERGASDVRGAAVDVASGIARLAGDRDILVTDTTRDIVAGSGLAFDDRGATTLEGAQEPRRVYAALG